MTITLVLNKNHSFVQSARTASGETSQITGKWWLDSNKVVEFDSFMDFLNGERGEGMVGAGFRPERWPRGVIMGPIIVKCPEDSYKVDYVQ